MSDGSSRIRERVRVECEVLAQLVFSRTQYEQAVAAGLDETSFAGMRERRVFGAIALHYKTEDNPPMLARLRELLGPTHATWVDELDLHNVLTTGDVVQLVNILRRYELQTQQRIEMARAADALRSEDIDTAQLHVDAARALQAKVDSGKAISRIEVITTSEIFAPLPPTRFISSELMIGPGRPTLIVGNGASGKTLAAQSLLIAIAVGKPIWKRFPVSRAMRVLHLDYEQGTHDTCRRYQRLAIGHEICPARDFDDRLRASILPSIYLSSDQAEQEMRALAAEVDVVLIDSLRAALPGVDENSSEVRRYLDMLTHVSEATGTTFIVLHHAGKPKEGGQDARMRGRGSSAIFDACGTVLLMEVGQAGSGVRRVQMTKAPASCAGGPLSAFELVIEDVASAEDPVAGVRVVYREISSDEGAELAVDRVVEAIRAGHGSSFNEIVKHARVGKPVARATLQRLEADGQVIGESGKNRSRRYRLAE